MKRILLAAALILGSNAAKADLHFNTSVFYTSHSKGDIDYSQKEAYLFIGMPVAAKEQLYLGINAGMTDNNASDGGMSTTEIGPRINYFINQDKTFLLTLAYHPYVKYNSGDYDAYSYLAGLGYEMKVNTNFYVGASIMYHSTTRTDNAANKDETFTTTRPMINFSFRFR